MINKNQDEHAQYKRDWVLQRLYDIDTWKMVLDYGDHWNVIRQNGKPGLTKAEGEWQEEKNSK